MTVALEDYLNDPDFEINRQQYKLAKEQAKAQKAQKTTSVSTKPLDNKPSDSKPKNDSGNSFLNMYIFLILLRFLINTLTISKISCNVYRFFYYT